MDVVLGDNEFGLFQKLIYDTAGIHMSAAKKTLVSGRLAKRVKQFGLATYSEYFHLINSPGQEQERQTAVNLLTTNETSFFREEKHFDFLIQAVFPQWKAGEVRRIWSAASSTGEEAYTTAMVMAEHAGQVNWEIIGTDISTQVLDKARTGHYSMDRASNIPTRYLHSYCLKGIGRQHGSFLVSKMLRDRVQFCHANLKSDLTALGEFDVIFLRNVLIYFDLPTKQQVVSQLIRQLKVGGYLLIGHSESLNGVTDLVQSVQPAVYRK